MPIRCFGSLNLDHVYSVSHFVQGGETIAASALSVFCGGKGLNQSIALSRAGAEVLHAGKVGRDGDMLVNLLRQAGVDTSRIAVEPEAPTGHAIIQVDEKSGQNCIIIYGGANAMVDPAYIDSVLADARPGELALFQNEISSLAYAIRRCREVGLRVAFNPSPCMGAALDESLYANVDWLILNEIEGNLLTGETEPARICQKLRQKNPGCRVVLTLGKEGAMYAGEDGTLYQRAYRVQAVDTTGAGDTFTGFFLACAAQGMEIGTALDLASRAAAISVSRKGAAVSIPTMEEVRAAKLATNDLP